MKIHFKRFLGHTMPYSAKLSVIFQNSVNAALSFSQVGQIKYFLAYEFKGNIRVKTDWFMMGSAMTKSSMFMTLRLCLLLKHFGSRLSLRMLTEMI